MSDDDRLLELAQALSDGTAKDWEREAASCDDPRKREVVRAFGLLASVQNLHASLREDVRVETVQPERWGPLRILELAGRGSFGTVYRAHDPQLDREVALKLRPAAEEQAATAIVAEGRLLARVRHPNVVTVHGVERHGDQVGLWMEFVDGTTLEDLLKERGPLGAREAVSVGLDLCGALSAVHAAGLIHGDVKTHNVMREQGGRLVLMDFGAGTPAEQDEADGHSQRTVSGTPLFMAPEILAGQSKTIRSDIYSLGVVLYYLLAGRFPVRASTVSELIRAQDEGERVPLRDERPDLPSDLLAVVERALARDPGQRFASTGELETALLTTQRSTIDKTRRGRIRALPFAAAAAVLITVAVWIAVNRFGTTVPPRIPLAASVSTELWRVGMTVDRLLEDGDTVRPGDHLYLTFESADPVHLYVVNLDQTGHGYLLFPVPEAQSSNPLPPGRNRLPGDTDWQFDSWEISSAGGRESFLVVAARQPLERLEAMIGSLVPASPDGPRALGTEVLDALRGAGRLSRSTTGEAGDGFDRALADALRKLSDEQLSDEEIFVREFVLQNPVAD